jgi:methylated-DNA-[protein]-cysteine S-methyltransferase
MPQVSFNSPVGPLTVTVEDGAVISVDWGWAAECEDTPLLAEARAQMEDYFDGRRTSFDLPLAPPGTAFQRRVWHAMSGIGYGQVLRYGELAEAVGSAARAIGQVCARNPLPILVPCHRVLGHANGGLGHYSGPNGPDDLDTKLQLLRLEGAALPDQGRHAA